MRYSALAEQGRAPLPPSRRLWGFWEFTWTNTSIAVATWGFLIGGGVAMVVGVRDGLVAILLGNIIGVLLVGLAISVTSGKYGVEQYTFLRSMFGPNGSRVVYILGLVLLTVGWLVVLGTMFGRAIDSAVSVVSDRQPDITTWWIPIVTVGAIVIVALMVAKGSSSIKISNAIVAPILLVMMGVMMYFFFQEYTLGEMMNLPAVDPPSESQLVNFIIAVEVNIACGFSWWPYVGNLSRITKTERIAYWPNLIGICCAAALGEVVGLLGATIFNDSDPTQWMAGVGGAALAFMVLIFVAFANVTSMATILYTAIAGLRQAFVRQLKKLSWRALVVWFCAVSVAVMFILPGLYDNFLTFMVWTAAMYASFTGIMLVDYYWLRRQRVPLADLFDETPNSAYYYWRGFSPAAAIAFVAGFIASTVSFNPQTWWTGPTFIFTTASLPAVVVAAAVYALIAPRMNAKRGWGAYPPMTATGTAQQTDEVSA